MQTRWSRDSLKESFRRPENQRKVIARKVPLEVVGGILGVRHYLDATDISSKRREWSTIYYVVVGLVGPVVLSVVWFDPLRTGMTRQHRLRLIGVVGSATGFLAVLLVLSVGTRGSEAVPEMPTTRVPSSALD
jgi:uncharacterized membrane protein YuzA (DUF378 family)